MSTSPPELLEQAKTLYESKERDYGESWRLTGIILANILQQQGEDELVVPAEAEYLSALGLYTRRLDKLVRSFNGTFLSDDFEVDESLSETINDQIPYAAMHTTLTHEMQAETDTSPETGHGEEDVPSEYCPNCGKLSTDSTALSGGGFEFYCGCGHVWMSST
jgi:hypothetical protein